MALELPAALSDVDRRLRTAPGDGAARLERATILATWGRRREASREYARALAGGQERAPVLCAIARTDLDAGDSDRALIVVEHALRLDPTDDRAKLLMARVRAARSEHDAARSILRELQSRLGTNAEYSFTYADCLRGCGDFETAIEVVDRAIMVHPEDHALHDLRGVLLGRLGRHDESFAAFRRSIELGLRAGLLVSATTNLGIGLAHAGRESESVEVLTEWLPRYADENGHLQLAQSQIALGRYAQGWRQYEHRWFSGELARIRPDPGIPAWSGQELSGATILVRSEQGMGDVFQMARYLPALAGLGARVLFAPLPGLERISARFPGVHALVDNVAPREPADFYANLMSLPRAFGTTVDTIPAPVPYLTAESRLVESWATRFTDDRRLRVGITWAGRPQHARDRERSIPLERLAPLLAVEDVRFYSLQKGGAAAQAEIVPASVDWVGVGPELDDVEDAAAVLWHLDLLISVDTGLAHLAAAMGKEVWLVLPRPADHRWMLEGERTPWYPTMRLFRQERPGAWKEVVARVAGELRRRAAARPPFEATATGNRIVESPDRAPLRPAVDEPTPHLAVAVQTRLGFVRMDPDAGDEGRSLEYYGEWLEGRGAYVRKLVRRGDVVVEAGTGAGVCALETARMLGPEGELLVYERSAALRGLLARNLEACGIRQVTLMSRELVGRGGFTKERERLDDLGLERLDGLKVNEGWDAEAVVEGAEQTLWRCRPWMVMAVDGEEAMSRLAERIRGYGYRTWRMEWPLFSADNFNRRYVDLFDGRAALALIALPEEEQQRTIPGESILLT
ncbi:MAG: hypothetical protein IT520_17295 [Burkholderiales bacterium]|nr:hypothetical protein [Burkholderiales bacterium]